MAGKKNITPLVRSANKVALACGLGSPFDFNSKVTRHKQVEGPFEGKELIKIFKAGKPSHMAMLLLEDGNYKCVTMKRDAREFEVPA